MEGGEKLDLIPLESPTNGASAVGLNSSGVTRRLSLGTAAEADIQTSFTDTTAGRVLKMDANEGPFGVGGLILSAETDLNNYTTSGRYLTPLTVLSNGPSGQASDRKVVIVDTRQTGGAIEQWLIERATARIWHRITSSSSLSGVSWNELLTTVDYPSNNAWTTATSLINGWTGTVRYVLRAGWVTVACDPIDGTSQTDDTLLNLPSAYWPHVRVRGAGVDTASSPDKVARITVGANGDISALGESLGSNLYATITYPVI
jgi:hypothetical protein